MTYNSFKKIVSILGLVFIGSFWFNGYCLSSPGEDKITPARDGEQVIISISGNWDFQLDPEKKGVEEKWYTKKLAETVILPGTTDENKRELSWTSAATTGFQEFITGKGPHGTSARLTFR